MELGGGRARTADPSRPEGCPKPHGTVLNGNWTVRGEGLTGRYHCLGSGWAASNCIVHQLFRMFYHHFPFLFCPIKMSLTQSMNFYLFSIYLPHSTE